MGLIAITALSRGRMTTARAHLGHARPRRRTAVLLDGINHIAWISKDATRLKAFYATVFDAEAGPTRPHGDNPGETMTVIRIGPHTELNIFTIDGNTEPERQTPMWGRGRIDHFGLQAASRDAFEIIRQRLIDAGASGGTVNDFGSALSLFFRDPDGLEGEVLLTKG
jgi:catechol 2,3-dioxygenase-like lactoylglutathione lyase family enzyme